MVANITTGKDIYGALAYNQRKVDRGKGTVLATSNIRFPADGRFGVAALADELLRWMPSHIRTEKPVVHISLNPDPEDRLSDDELTDIAAEYMEGMGWGGQPYVVYKHTDIDRPHIHIVTVQVDSSGRKIGDSRRNERSVAETEKIERKYGLHRAKGRKRGELWQLAPVEPEKGDLKRQIASVVKPVLSMYRFQTLGELRALLSLYRIGVEEVGGTRCGRSYRGLLYTVLDENGEKTQAAPLKASRLGDDASLTKIERVMASSGEKSEGKKLHELTRHRVGEALLDTMDETELRERLGSGISTSACGATTRDGSRAQRSSTMKPAACSTARGWARRSRPMRCMNGSPPAGKRSPNSCGSRGAGRKFGRHIPRAGNSIA